MLTSGQPCHVRLLHQGPSLCPPGLALARTRQSPWLRLPSQVGKPVLTCSACSAPYAGRVLEALCGQLGIDWHARCMTLCLSSPRPLPVLLLMTLRLLWPLRPPSLMLLLPQLP